MSSSKIFGFAFLATTIALTGCANRKPKVGALGSYGDGVGYANSTDSGTAGTDGIGNNGDLRYSNSGLPGTGGNNVIYFDYDSSSLSPKSYGKLNKHVTYLKQNTNTRVTLAGHADERGTREYNAALGERRANAVKNYLTTNGVSSSQIDTVSYGEERPVGNYQQNRRVEVTY